MGPDSQPIRGYKEASEECKEGLWVLIADTVVNRAQLFQKGSCTTLSNEEKDLSNKRACVKKAFLSSPAHYCRGIAGQPIQSPHVQAYHKVVPLIQVALV